MCFVMHLTLGAWAPSGLPAWSQALLHKMWKVGGWPSPELWWADSCSGGGKGQVPWQQNFPISLLFC